MVRPAYAFTGLRMNTVVLPGTIVPRRYTWKPRPA